LNEVALSSDLNTITAEINTYKELAGQSIWEIGRRLNHVKENDLAHGQFGNWLSSIGINHPEANRIMRVAKDIPNSSTLKNIGSTALYLISTLPEEKKREEIEKASQGDPSTVRELQQLKRDLKHKSDELAKQQEKYKELQIDYQDEVQANINHKKPDVIEKEVVPEDYESTKRNLKELQEKLQKQQDLYNDLLDRNKETHKKANELDYLKERIGELTGQMNAEQEKLVAYKHISKFVSDGEKLLIAIAPLSYLQDLSRVDYDAKEKVQSLVNKVSAWVDDMQETLNKDQIIEGEIINE